MSEFGGLRKHENNQHALVSLKTECGCPSGGGIKKSCATPPMEERRKKNPQKLRPIAKSGSREPAWPSDKTARAFEGGKLYVNWPNSEGRYFGTETMCWCVLPSSVVASYQCPLLHFLIITLPSTIFTPSLPSFDIIRRPTLCSLKSKIFLCLVS